MSSIYGLYDKHGRLRYIGKARCPASRLKTHMREARLGRRDYPVYLWIRKNGPPEMRVLEADCEDWREAEKRLISEARARGERLLNVADGGDEPCMSADQRRDNAAKCNEAMSSDPAKCLARDLRCLVMQHMRAIKNSGFLDEEWLERMRAKALRCEELNPTLFSGFGSAF